MEGAGRVWPGSLQDLTAAVCCRYVEVFEANPLDVEKAKDREDGGGRGGRDRDRGRRSGGGFTVTLRGLPYRASEREIADWLSEAADPEDVIIVMDRSVARIGNILDSTDEFIQNRETEWSGRRHLQRRERREVRYYFVVVRCEVESGVGVVKC